MKKPELMTDDELFHELTVINNKPFYYGQSIVKEVLIRLFTKHMQRQSPNPTELPDSSFLRKFETLT